MNLQRQIGLTKSELITTILCFVVIFFLVFSIRLVRLTSGDSLVFEEETEIILEEATSLSALQEQLRSIGVQYQPEEMQWAANLLGWRRFQRGRYEFDGAYSYNGFLSKMARGIQDPVSVVVLPGITPERLAERLGNSLDFSADSLKAVFSDSLFLAEKSLTREELFGRMLPETYLIYWTSQPVAVIEKILRQFDQSFTEEMKERAAGLELSIDEVVTLASIIEWEAKNQAEMSTISGLYWNRLNRGMLLQADPTVNFALGERRRLLYEDYQIDHPYNTYKIKGLPPGPITNPSLAAIEAALNPEEHNYLYMVANPEGGHVFTRTYQEHLEESEKWRRWLREQYRIKRQREAEQSQENSR
ncbi:endolytic transglycosylase MltG [Gracilimonas mengyeensis]|uniref:Endolytic murein transglycosylase n=1 Tax=Gracilimonas mengyeensis TaxID=1302730 RepID=A0A521AIK4_9BACT|nr:endolytic transglycosylase MltG [Gracilimonas mengyeensis]SMO34659.1 UPF0755 protein [Gracilimonas mengyeensis]